MISSTRPAVANVSAARYLPANSSPRLRDRVRIVFQVPKWSSAEKMSPATTAVPTGSSHWPPNPRITIGTANPEVCSHWPNAVSLGVALCTCRPGHDEEWAHQAPQQRGPAPATGHGAWPAPAAIR